MFERFTDRARRVVVLAQEEARMRGHDSIGTEHILLGLIQEREGMAARALTSLGVRLDTVREQVEEIIGQGQTAPAGHIPFTPRAKKVLELSLREALQLGHDSIGTEHILLGLIREGEGVAAQVLQNLGASLERIRQTVVRIRSGMSGADPPAPRTRPFELLEDLTDAALAALAAARAEARRVGLDTVEAGPLFVALLTVPEGAAARTLLGQELGLGRLRVALGEDVEQPTLGDATPLPFSTSARTALGATATMVGGAVGTGHIARALIDDDSITALLRAASADLGKVRKAVAGLDGDGGLP